MSTATHSIKSTQIVAGVAVVLALLGGAYAVGRSHDAAPEPMAAVTQPAPVDERQPPRVVASAEPVRQAQPIRETRPARDVQQAPAEFQSPPALCESCGRVTDVHSETRHGSGSGVGAVGGAVVGGLLGNMIGGGNGRKLATVGGAVAGGYAGNEIEKNRKTYSVWVVEVQERDGRMRRFERSNDPGLRVGDEVRLTDGGFSRV